MVTDNRLRVAVLMGGPSPEYEVSLASGRHVVRRLPRDEFDVIPVEVDRDGTWRAFDYDAYIPLVMPREPGTEAPPTPLPVCTGIEAVLRTEPPVDVAFIAMHGPYGEDGTVQAILEAFGVPYTGSGVLASALAMSKSASKAMFEVHEVITPEWREVRQALWDRGNAEELAEDLGLPLMIKADASGSSIGVYRCENPQEIAEAVEACLALSPIAIAEEFLEGTELTVPVVGDSLRQQVLPLAVTEIRHNGAFFDYERKYSDPNTREITPATVANPILLMARGMAARAHAALGCAGITRTDLIWVPTRELEGGQPYVAVLEVNTVPGMTPVSIIPRGVEATGGNFTDLLIRLIEEALPVEEPEDA